ncbi:hypothetical protein SAMN05519103_00329 [Rhizobiales bacterium GAS113]|nr:hypothetical protein SAMN05519103_00329 [Rhizobiales bacterium GAS113]
MTLAGPLRGPLRKRESHMWEREANDHYVEPAWCSERLFELPLFRPGMMILDPACGFGTIVESAMRAGMCGFGSDVIPRWRAIPDRAGYYDPREFEEMWPSREFDAIVSNPPFKVAREFAELAIERSGVLAALLLPANWVQGMRRSRWLAASPLHSVLFICPRPSMPPGHVILAGGKPGNGTTDYAWFIWVKGYDGTPQIGWLHRDGERA